MVYVYADTSVIGGCFDVEFREWSMALFDEFKAGTKKVIVSDVVRLELERANSAVRTKLNQVPFTNRIYIGSNPEAEKLAQSYIDEGALTNKSMNDALHIAHATLIEADVLASWNFKHIVNFEKIKLYNAINRYFGFRTIDIRTPREILNVTEYEKI